MMNAAMRFICDSIKSMKSKILEIIDLIGRMKCASLDANKIYIFQVLRDIEYHIANAFKEMISLNKNLEANKCLAEKIAEEIAE